MATGPRTNNSKYVIWWKSEVGRLKGNIPRIVENPLMLLATATCKVRGLPQLVCSGAVATVPCPRCVHGNQWIHPIKSCRLASMWLWQDMLAVFLQFSEFLWGTKCRGLEEQLTHSVMKDVQLWQTKSVLIKIWCASKKGKRSKRRDERKLLARITSYHNQVWYHKWWFLKCSYAISLKIEPDWSDSDEY